MAITENNSAFYSVSLKVLSGEKMGLFTPGFIEDWRTLIRQKGLKGFFKEKGWKFVAAIVLFYLIRDTFLYIILPLLVFQNMSTCQ